MTFEIIFKIFIFQFFKQLGWGYVDDLGQWYYKGYDTIWEVVHCFGQNTERQAWITRGNSYDQRKWKFEDLDEECDF